MKYNKISQHSYTLLTIVGCLKSVLCFTGTGMSTGRTVSRAREKCTQECLALYDPCIYANVVATSYMPRFEDRYILRERDVT